MPEWRNLIMIGKINRIVKKRPMVEFYKTALDKAARDKIVQNENAKKALGSVVGLIVGPSIVFGGIGLGLVSFVSVISFFRGDR